jgi:hypothetical protein
MRKIAVIVVIGLILASLVGTAAAQRKFSGVVERMPPQGYLGIWIISGRPVEVIPDTKLDFDRGLPGIGSFVKIKGVQLQDRYVAYEIETRRPRY